MAVGLTLMAMDVLGLFPGSVLVHNAVVSVMSDECCRDARSFGVVFTTDSVGLRTLHAHC